MTTLAQATGPTGTGMTSRAAPTGTSGQPAPKHLKRRPPGACGRQAV
jgi:hypothetical protein